MAANIEHTTTITEVWFILHGHTLNSNLLAVALRVKNHLAKALQAIEYSLLATALDYNALLGNIEQIFLLRKRLVNRERDNALALWLLFNHR